MGSDSTAQLFISQFQTPVNIAPSANLSTSPTSDRSSSNDMTASTDSAADDKAKRLTACLVCRKRKLKCDSARPKCASCARLGHACGYEETRKKSGPKQGYVKKLEQKSQTLEQRLAQLEKLLATHQTQQSASPSINTHLPTPPGISPLPYENISAPGSASSNTMNQFSFQSTPSTSMNPNMFSTQPMFPDLTSPESNSNNIKFDTFPLFNHDPSPGNQNAQDSSSNPMESQWAWDLVSLGMQEELPPEEITNKLTEQYFEKSHSMLPFLHRARFMAALQLPPNIGVPVPLRYAVWALGASCANDPSLRAYKDVFYTRARRTMTDLLETSLDSLKPHRISTLQTLVLICTYEFLHANFGHAWMNCGRAARMSVYFNLMRLDEPHLFCKQTLVESRDWIDQEERRRTFWAAFMLDRFASLGTGWAATFNEEDITTFLPGPDDEYQAGIGMLGETTGEPLYPSSKVSAGGNKKIGTFGAVLRITAFLGRLNIHVNRPNQEKDYIVRHRELDNLLATIQFSIPQHLKYVPGSQDMRTAFLQNLTSVASILLNQAALYKSQLTELPLRLSDLASRCHMGAMEIASTIRGTSNVHVTLQCAYTAFCIYVGARVFVEMLRQPGPTAPPASGPTREALQSDLSMMLAALQTFTEHVPLAGHFLMQLEADLNGLEKVVSVRPYDVTVGYAECHIFHQTTGTAGTPGITTTSGSPSPMSLSSGIWAKGATNNNSVPDFTFARQQQFPTQAFDMRGPDRFPPDRFTYVDNSRNNSLGKDNNSTGSGSSSNPGSVGVLGNSSDNTPNTTTPESIRQFDPDKIFGDMNFSTAGIDVTMDMGQGMGDDGGIEYFTEMLGVNLNGGN